jgi:GH15 family glucan-1,4-alpha-glucosidase
MPARIEDYALIGDCETAALIGRDGSLDWLCWPRFDSPACFAALLGGPEHGRWLIAPASNVVEVSRAYRTDTLILETRFVTPEGTVLLADFMPLRGTNSDVIRQVTGLQGRVSMHGTYSPRRLRTHCAMGDPDRGWRPARHRRTSHVGYANGRSPPG